MWVDNHCHLPVGDPEGLAALLADARADGVHGFVNVGCDLDGSRAAILSAAAHADVFATVGVHPHEASGGIEGIAELAGGPEVVAIGECGLDYHYLHSPRDDQRRVFAAQIRLAHELDLALVIHTREAWEETFEILEREGAPERTVFHCFTGGPAEADRCLQLGAVISFSGIVTFPGAEDVREAVRACPLDRMMVETDSPYLAPVPHRGRKNRPGLVGVVGARLAEIRGVAPEEIARATTCVAEATYRLPASSVNP